MATCNFYPMFEANQVLTAKQLNQVFEYLDKQERLTRYKLIGAGNMCGFDVVFKTGAVIKIIISKGCGITTEGYLIAEETSTFTRYREYKDPAKYFYFGNEESQITLWELLPEVVEEESSNIKKLNASFLNDKAIILYLEKKEVDLETCTGDDCNEKGIRIDLCVKKLLVKISDLKDIIRQEYKFSKFIDIDSVLNAKFRLPEIEIPRSSLAEYISKNTFIELHKYYSDLITSSLAQLTKALSASYISFSPILQNEFKENPFAGLNMHALFNSVDKNNPCWIQYFYDFIKDLVLAYNEFKEAAFDLTAKCCIEEKFFPMHLMLGEATGYNKCEPSIFRHGFFPAPLYNNQDGLLEKVLMLFKRMVLMTKGFWVISEKEALIKITPSKEKRTHLSQHSIPYYYHPKYEINKYWNYELKRKCKNDFNLSYNSEYYSTPYTPLHIKKPLNFNIDSFPFVRIEGHIEKNYEEVIKNLYAQIEKYNLPIKVLGLKLGKDAKEGEEEILDCHFQDLELLYSTLRYDLFCFLEKEIAFFASLDYKEAKESVEKKPGGLRGTVVDSTGAALPGVNVILKAVGNTSMAADRQATTDMKGVFQFEDVPSGSYTLTVYHIGFGQSTTSIKVEPLTTAVTTVTLKEAAGTDQPMLEHEDIKKILYRDMISGFDTGKIKRDVFEVEFKGKPKISKGDFLTLSMTRGITRESTGMVYNSFIKSAYSGNMLGFINDYVKSNPSLNLGKNLSDIYNKVYYPLQIIDRIEDIVSALSTNISQFNYSDASSKQSLLVTSASNYKKQITDNLNNPDYKPHGKENEILIHLQNLIDTCYLQRFNTILITYKKRQLEVRKLTLFSYFLKDNPGMEHLAGVYFGGTFILVHDGSKVVADFALPFNCCSHCPPIAVIIPTAPVIFKLPKNTYCKDDNTDYEFILSPDTGEVTGPGVSPNPPYKFNPSKAGAGSKTLIYKINLTEHELIVNVIDVKAGIIYKINKPGEDKIKREVVFTAVPEGADSYSWDFGDQSETSNKATTVHEYNIETIQEFEVKLTVTKSGCKSEAVQKIVIPYCTAQFDYVVEGIKDNIAIVQFNSVMDDAEKYIWNFGDGSQFAKVPDPFHKYDLSNVQSFDVVLTVIKGDCQDIIKQSITITPCPASFDMEIGEPVGNTLEVYFNCSLLNADVYEWDFGDKTESINKPQLTHKYLLTEIQQNLDVKLKIQRGICTSTSGQKLTLPPAQDISIKLDKTTFCKKDKPFKFSYSTPGGNVTGKGVIKRLNDFYFDPSHDDVKAGQIEFTYMLPNGQTSKLTVRVLNPIAEFKVKKVFQPNPEIQPYTYQVILANKSRDAQKFVWRVKDRIFSEEANPALILNDVKPGDQIEIFLIAAIEKCSDLYSDIITIPPAVPGGTINIDTPGGGFVIVTDPAGNADVTTNPAINRLKVNLSLLNNLSSHSAFYNALTANVAALKDTKKYLSELNSELENATTRRLYSLGKRNGIIAENMNDLVHKTVARIEKYDGAGMLKNRQFTYNLIMIQISQLFNLINMQKNDLSVNDPLISVFTNLTDKLNYLRELKVNINPNNRLTALSKAAMKEAANKPVYMKMLRKFNTVIG